MPKDISDDIKKNVRSVLISNPKGVLMKELLSDYQKLLLQRLNFSSLGYRSLVDFLEAMPDVAKLEWAKSKGTYRIFAVTDSSLYVPSFLRGNICDTTGTSHQSIPLTLREKWEEALAPNLKGQYAVCFNRLPSHVREEISDDFGSVGDVAEVSFVNRYVFIRYNSREEAMAALETFYEKYSLWPPLERSDPKQVIKKKDSYMKAVKRHPNNELVEVYVGMLPSNVTQAELLQRLDPEWVYQIRDLQKQDKRYMFLVVKREFVDDVIGCLHHKVIGGQKIIAQLAYAYENNAANNEHNPQPAKVVDAITTKVVQGHMGMLSNLNYEQSSSTESIEMYGVDSCQRPNELEPALPGLEPALPDLEPALPGLEPALPDLEPALPDLEAVLSDVEDDLLDLETALPGLEPAMPRREPALPDLEPVLPKLEPASSRITPLLPTPVGMGSSSSIKPLLMPASMGLPSPVGMGLPNPIGIGWVGQTPITRNGNPMSYGQAQGLHGRHQMQYMHHNQLLMNHHRMYMHHQDQQVNHHAINDMHIKPQNHNHTHSHMHSQQFKKQYMVSAHPNYEQTDTCRAIDSTSGQQMYQPGRSKNKLLSGNQQAKSGLSTILSQPSHQKTDIRQVVDSNSASGQHKYLSSCDEKDLLSSYAKGDAIVHLANFQFGTSRIELTNIFSDLNLKPLRIDIDPEFGNSLSTHAVMYMKNEAQANDALQVNNMLLNGRNLFVFRDTSNHTKEDVEEMTTTSLKVSIRNTADADETDRTVVAVSEETEEPEEVEGKGTLWQEEWLSCQVVWAVRNCCPGCELWTPAELCSTTIGIAITSTIDDSHVWGQVIDTSTSEEHKWLLDMHPLMQLDENHIRYIPSSKTCAALYEKEWFRGYVEGVKQDTASVFAIDYGNMVKQPVQMLRDFPVDFWAVTAQAWPIKVVSSVFDDLHSLDQTRVKAEVLNSNSAMLPLMVHITGQ